MHKFVIRKRKKRKYTRKVKELPSFSIIKTLYGVIPLIIIAVAFMATLVISASFRNSLSQIRFSFHIPTLPHISLNNVQNSTRSLFEDIDQAGSISVATVIVFFIFLKNFIYLGIYSLINFFRLFNPYPLFNTLFSHVQNTDTMLFRIFPTVESIITKSAFFSYSLMFEVAETAESIIKIISLSIYLFIEILIKNIIRTTFHIFPLLISDSAAFGTIVYKAIFDYLISINNIFKISFFAVSSFFEYIASIILKDVFHIIPTIISTSYTLVIITSNAIINCITIFYNDLIYVLNVISQNAIFILNTSFSLLYAFSHAITVLISSIIGSILHVISIPFITLKQGYIQIKPYLNILYTHFNMAGNDFMKCFTSFDKITSLLSHQK